MLHQGVEQLIFYYNMEKIEQGRTNEKSNCWKSTDAKSSALL